MSPTAPSLQRLVPVPPGYDLRGSLGFASVAFLEPAAKRTDHGLWKAAHTPSGPVTLHLASEGDAVRVEAWGEGSEWAASRVEALLGLRDAPEAFRPTGPDRLRRLARKGRGVHLPRSPWVFDTLAAIILQQRVRFREAARSLRRLAMRFGEPAPGGFPELRLPLRPAQWRGLSQGDFERAGIDGQRARALRAAAREARRVDATFDLDATTGRAILAVIPGCGPWTVEMTMGVALGDPDAVPTGDLHLPAMVAWALAGEFRGDDRRMLELLEPYRGHRFRLLRLLLLGRAPVPRLR